MKRTEGIISFGGFADGLQDIIKTCEKDELYYALGSNTISDENYEAVKDNQWYMGSVGPHLEDVYQSGCDMAEYFLDKGAKNFVIMSGGASSGNRLHQGFWTATTQKEYTELYGYATGIYENAYSCDDLQGVIKVFTEDTTPEKFKELTESYTVEDVKARIFGEE